MLDAPVSESPVILRHQIPHPRSVRSLAPRVPGQFPNSRWVQTCPGTWLPLISRSIPAQPILFTTVCCGPAACGPRHLSTPPRRSQSAPLPQSFQDKDPAEPNAAAGEGSRTRPTVSGALKNRIPVADCGRQTAGETIAGLRPCQEKFPAHDLGVHNPRTRHPAKPSLPRGKEGLCICFSDSQRVLLGDLDQALSLMSCRAYRR